MTKNHLLFLIILLEGYAVLAAELLAMRQLIPYVGSGTDVVAIVVSGVLLPLALGYQAGGKRWRELRAGGSRQSVRSVLQRNFLIAAIFLIFALATICLEIFFTIAESLNTPRLLQAGLHVCLFLVYPIYLLGQTLPLISHYFRHQELTRWTGRILMVSTLGSFAGSLLTTLVLMNTLGVHLTVIVTVMLLLMSFLLLAPLRRAARQLPVFLLLSALVFFLNGTHMQRWMHIVSDNAYNTVSVVGVEEKPMRLMMINRSPSSLVAKNPADRFPYIRFIEEKFITPSIITKTPREILVIGAGGFTLGQYDVTNHYTYVDIDPDLRKTAEQHLLLENLTPNKRFEAASARAYVHHDTKHYDLIVVDVYSNSTSMPQEAITREFWQEVKARLGENGMMVANIAASPTFADTFSRRMDNTLRSVFPHMINHVIDRLPWYPANEHKANIMYVYRHAPEAADTTIYTDDKNSYALDR